MTEPVAVNPWMLNLWRAHHNDTPLLIFRCAPASCGRILGKVWPTAEGLLMWTVTHVAATPITVAGDASPVLNSGLAPFDWWRPGSGTARAVKLPDEAGTVSLLDRDDYWFGAEAGCDRHPGLIEIDRVAVLDRASLALRSNRTPRTVALPLAETC